MHSFDYDDLRNQLLMEFEQDPNCHLDHKLEQALLAPVLLVQVLLVQE